MEVERVWSKTNTHALDNAVKALLEEERGQYDSKFRTVLSYVTLIGASVLLLSATLWYFWRRRNKRIIAEKERELAELEEMLSDATEEVIELAKKNGSTKALRFKGENPLRLHKTIPPLPCCGRRFGHLHPLRISPAASQSVPALLRLASWYHGVCAQIRQSRSRSCFPRDSSVSPRRI